MLIALIVGGVLFLGVVVFLVFALVIKTERDQETAETRAASILDATFDGRPDVTFSLNMRTLKYETVVTGAKIRGYKLVHQADNQYGPRTLMFEKL